jgi:hypothetical protein
MNKVAEVIDRGPMTNVTLIGTITYPHIVETIAEFSCQ